MISVNYANVKRFGGARAIALTRKNLKSARWYSIFGLAACGCEVFGMHGWAQYGMLACAAYLTFIHVKLAIHYSRQLKILEQGGEVDVTTTLPEEVIKTPWTLDFILVLSLSLLVLACTFFPLIVISGAYAWWAKTLSALFGGGMIFFLIFAWKKLYADRDELIRSANPPWLIKAAAAVPQLKKEILQESAISDLWVMLSYFFERAYEPETRDDRLIRDIYAFAEWCLLSSDQEMGEDEAQELKEGATAFYESAANSPFGGADSINHVSQAVRAELERASLNSAL